MLFDTRVVLLAAVGAITLMVQAMPTTQRGKLPMVPEAIQRGNACGFIVTYTKSGGRPLPAEQQASFGTYSMPVLAVREDDEFLLTPVCSAATGFLGISYSHKDTQVIDPQGNVLLRIGGGKDRVEKAHTAQAWNDPQTERTFLVGEQIALSGYVWARHVQGKKLTAPLSFQILESSSNIHDRFAFVMVDNSAPLNYPERLWQPMNYQDQTPILKHALADQAIAAIAQIFKPRSNFQGLQAPSVADPNALPKYLFADQSSIVPAYRPNQSQMVEPTRRMPGMGQPSAPPAEEQESHLVKPTRAMPGA